MKGQLENSSWGRKIPHHALEILTSLLVLGFCLQLCCVLALLLSSFDLGGLSILFPVDLDVKLVEVVDRVFLQGLLISIQLESES